MTDATIDPGSCFHCGLEVTHPGRWFTEIEGRQQTMCCAGCQAVAQAIVDAGLDDYYRNRTTPASGPSGLPVELADLAIYDEPEIAERYLRVDGQTVETTLLMDGLRCGACVWLIERSLAALPGVTNATVNFATERAVVRWNPTQTSLSRLLSRVTAMGYRAQPFDAQRREAQLARGTRQLVRRLFVAGIGMMQVMMYALPRYTAGDQMEPEFELLMRWASLVLTLPVVLYSARPFLEGALRDLRARSLGMDVPVAIGILAAFSASLHATVTGQGEVYFDSVTMFVFLLLTARYLEWIARRRASRAVDAMAAALPERVSRLLEEPEKLSAQALSAIALEQIPAARVTAGELLRVASGERFAVDGLIVAGDTAVDQSLLTGESVPIPKKPGDEVAGGAVNAGNPVWIRVLRASADSTLSTIERLVERAATDKPTIAQSADRVASWFVTALLALAAIIAMVWWTIDPSRTLAVTVAVLVVSCPCALSLATPAALAAATGALTRRGILVTSGKALETIARCTDVVFDKTGTLTTGKPKLVAIHCFGAMDEPGALAMAAALGAGSSHPLASALTAAAQAQGLRLPGVGMVQVQAGRGVQGQIDGSRLRLGSAIFAAEWAELPGTGHEAGADAQRRGLGASAQPVKQAPGSSAADAPDSQVWLASEGVALARFSLQDTLRDDAPGTVRALAQAGLRTHLLSGDHKTAVMQIAQRLEIHQVQAQATPSDKLDYVRKLQQAGRRVLMVGDGVNDAPVLAAADASLAVGDATALARTAADTVLLSPKLGLLVQLVWLTRDCHRVIRQNLAWAALYNAVAIPAAALGWVPAWGAALGMSCSSLLVVANALRLRMRTEEPRAGEHR
jgi:Cu2+-exporting ATPase